MLIRNYYKVFKSNERNMFTGRMSSKIRSIYLTACISKLININNYIAGEELSRIYRLKHDD